jgi:hypothetical protein
MIFNVGIKCSNPSSNKEVPWKNHRQHEHRLTENWEL